MAARPDPFVVICTRDFRYSRLATTSFTPARSLDFTLSADRILRRTRCADAPKLRSWSGLARMGLPVSWAASLMAQPSAAFRVTPTLRKANHGDGDAAVRVRAVSELP